MRSCRKRLLRFDHTLRPSAAALALLALGILVFAANNTLRFFMDADAYFWPGLIMKGITDCSWMAVAALGAARNRTKRNMLLLPVLLFYAAGDIAVMFSIPVGGIFYAFGHIFFLGAILETTYIRRYQKIAGSLLMLVPVLLLPGYVDSVPVLIIGLVYGFIVMSVMAASLSNRFYRLAGVVFTISDLAGLARMELANNHVTYLITTTIYFTAYFLLCVSVFSTSRKEVVTWGDLSNLLKSRKAHGVRFWVCGKWGMGLILGRTKFSYPLVELAYAADEEPRFEKWLKANRYRPEAGGPVGVRDYYSEKYGSLRVLPCAFRKDGKIVLTTAQGDPLELDEGYFAEIRVFGRRIPCVAPGGQALIREAAAGEDAP